MFSTKLTELFSVDDDPLTGPGAYLDFSSLEPSTAYPTLYDVGMDVKRRLSFFVRTLNVITRVVLFSERKEFLPVYEIALTVATCGLRISEALGLKWCDILWQRRLIAIRQTFVHFNLQNGAKTKLTRSRVEAPQLLLDVLHDWRRETMYAEDDDFVFPSTKLHGSQPLSASMLVEDYLWPAALRSGVLKQVDDKTYGPDGEEVKRFGFHVLGRHSLTTLLMDEGHNPAVIQAMMRHSKMDMTLYYSHSQRREKRAALDKIAAPVCTEKGADSLSTGARTGACHNRVQ